MTSCISAAAAGQNWRDVVRKLVKSAALEIERSAVKPNIGFLYVTDKLTKDSRSILELLRTITDIPYWIGVSGEAVFSRDAIYRDKPAASCLLMYIDPSHFSILGLNGDDYDRGIQCMVDQHHEVDALTTHLYQNAEASFDPNVLLNVLHAKTASFFTGALSSARGAHAVFTHNKQDNAAAAICFSPEVVTASSVFDGVIPVSKPHKVSNYKKTDIMALDGQPVKDVLSQDLENWLKANHDHVDEGQERDLKSLITLFRAAYGDLCLAFKDYKSDMPRQLIHPLLSYDEKAGALRTIHNVQENEELSFVFRDITAIKKDLAQKLMRLRQRLSDQDVLDSVVGGIYISNIGRYNKDAPNIEMTLIKEILGDIPLAGFCSTGEIHHRQLYSYTGVLTLFINKVA